jgi:hypothetical protein
MTQESSDALSARSVLLLAARVIMIHVDELPLLKRLAAHPAGVSLDLQKQIEVLLRQAVAGYPVLSVGLLSGLG